MIATRGGDRPGDKLLQVASAGDFDGDGIDDVVVGATQWERGGFGYGRVLSGRDLSMLAETRGRFAGDHCGWRVCPVGDVDEDGFADVAIALPNAQPTGFGSGEVRVLFGPNGFRVRRIMGDLLGTDMGREIATAAPDPGGPLNGLWILNDKGKEARLHTGPDLVVERVLRRKEKGWVGATGAGAFVWLGPGGDVLVEGRGQAMGLSGSPQVLGRSGDRWLVGFRTTSEGLLESVFAGD